jgi:ankyrin repeat protein
MSAVISGTSKDVTSALRSGADPNIADRDIGTPLYRASVSGHTLVVRLLVRAGADPNVESIGPGSDGIPLCAAACWGHAETVRELLAAGANPLAREDHGEGLTASEWAARGGWTATLAVLQSAGATAPH